MRQQSASSLTTFLKCPYSYKLKYLDNKPSLSSPEMEFGKWVEKQLLEPTPHDDSTPFRKSFSDFLKKEDDQIVRDQVKIEFEMGGHDFQGFIDFETKNQLALEVKVTKNPNYYLSTISYQMKMYALGLKERGLKLVYLMFEIDKDNQFKKLHVINNFFSSLSIKEGAEDILATCKLIEACEEQNTFPPSYNSCFTCFMRESCDKFSSPF